MVSLRRIALFNWLVLASFIVACDGDSNTNPDASAGSGGAAGVGGESGASGSSGTGGDSGASGSSGTGGGSGSGAGSGGDGDEDASVEPGEIAPVLLGMAEGYVVLAKTGISTVPDSTLTGDLGLSPAAASFVTGFSLVADATNVFATSTQVVGEVHAADYAAPTPSNLTTAVSNMEAAYNDAAGRSSPDFLELGTGDIGGRTLAPGLYKWTSTVTIPTDVTISGTANDVWIFQTSGDLVMDADKQVTLSGGALPENIFWQVAGEATFGADSHFEGIILSKTAITLQTGATMNGRALAQTQIALQQATITQP